MLPKQSHNREATHQRRQRLGSENERGTEIETLAKKSTEGGREGFKQLNE